MPRKSRQKQLTAAKVAIALAPFSCVTNCFIQARTGDTPFMIDDGILYVKLRGYAIIPIEEYFELRGEPMPEGWFGSASGHGGILLDNFSDVPE